MFGWLSLAKLVFEGHRKPFHEPNTAGRKGDTIRQTHSSGSRVLPRDGARE